MANGRIESADELRSYLSTTETRERLTIPEMASIVSSAVFENGQFRGMFLGAISTKFSEGDINALRRALGDPPVHADCYPAADRCVARDNCWCAHSRPEQR